VGFLGDAEFQAMFDGVTTEFTLDYVSDRTLLVAAAVTRRPLAVLLPVRDGAGITCAPLAVRLGAEAPDVRVITLWRPEHDRDQLVDIIRIGGELLSIASVNELVDCLNGLHRTGALSAADTDAVRSLLADLHPASMVEILLAAVGSAHRALSVDDLAQLVGISRRTLGRKAAEAGWPAPEELIDWGRLLRASMIHWRESARLVAMAHASGFTGPPALHRAAARLLDEDVVLPGALTPLGVSAALRRRLAELGG
jgi:AraC-like DNA-binding protein